MTLKLKLKGSSIAVNILLFLLTVISTTAAGALQQGVSLAALFKDWTLITRGIPFSFTLLAILIAHEMSHYFVSRYHGVRVTLPFFIPAPSVIGTFGAFIRIKSPMEDRRVLLDIGLSGPLGGAVVAIPVLYIGLKMSTIQIMLKPTGVELGSSILLDQMVRFTLGKLPDYYQVVLHPVAFAGWIGLLVTSLNLIPIGQLDGGHIAYAILGEKSKKLAIGCFIALIILGLVGWSGWFIWAGLLYVMGWQHPPPLNPAIPLDTKRKWLGVLALILFVVTFTPTPFSG
ncbi:MAG: site-2 protease family protein, partial [Deltaproteobacteria bacterium]|nr:site-2 protease family protein [Deltaproteobacteria bacterium]